MAYEATSRRPGPILRIRAAVGQAVRALDGDARSDAWRAFAWSRAAIAAVAIFAALTMAGPGTGGVPERNAAKFDVPELTHPLGGLGDALLSPLARWDAVWYLAIADSGYPEGQARPAFFPLYPLLSRGAGELGGGSAGAVLVASYLVSLAALLAALYLLHRLVALELGRRLAMPVLLLLCVFPASFFLGAPYSESLFLLVSVGAFYAARTGHWAWAGTCAAAAAATRSAGIVLLLPLAILYLHGPREDRPGETGRHPLRPDAAWLALAPLGLLGYALYLHFATGDGLAFLELQEAWHRHFAGPLGGVWDGTVAAFDGVRQLLSGSREHVYFDDAAGDPFRIAGMNLMLFGFLVFAAVGSYGVLRRLPFAYGAWVVAALALPLSFPVGPQPLMSLPRFLCILFPLFMWLGLVCEERRLTARLAGVSGVLLGLMVTQFATWHWVS